MPGMPHGGSRRCSICAIHYPRTKRVCAVCEEELKYHESVPPDHDWAEQVHYLLGLRSESGDIPTVQGRVEAKWGELFIAQADVVVSGLPRLEDGDLVRVGKQVFEVMGYSEETREYWVRSASAEVNIEDMAWLATQ